MLEALRDALAIAISDRPDAKTEMSVNVSAETSVESRLKTPELILKILSEEPSLTLSEVAERIGKSARTVERAASALVKVGRLRFVGPRKGGFWEVLDSGSQQ